VGIGTIYHNLLFSFQGSLKIHLGSRSGIFIHPALDHLPRMEEQEGLKIGNSKTLEEARASDSQRPTNCLKGGVCVDIVT